MKRLFIIAIATILAITHVACVDGEFDLSNIDTSNITIGNDNSEFKIPLATVSIAAQDICKGVKWDEVSIKELYETISVWFPKSLPNDASFIEIGRLMNDEEYFQQIFDAFYNEIKINEQKRVSACEYVIKYYRSDLIELLIDNSNSDFVSIARELEALPDDKAASLLAEAVLLFPDEIKTYLYDLSRTDVPNLTLNDIDIEIPSLEVSEDIKELLSENLDNSSIENPVNALYLYGSIESDFPFKFNLSPVIKDTIIDFGKFSVDQGQEKIEDIRIYKEDLQVLFNGSRLHMPINVVRYYLYKNFDDDCKITIKLHLRKTGGLKM